MIPQDAKMDEIERDLKNLRLLYDRGKPVYFGEVPGSFSMAFITYMAGKDRLQRDGNEMASYLDFVKFYRTVSLIEPH